MEASSSDITNCLMNGLRRMYNTQSYTDVIINVDNQSFPCHRVILSSVSTYFDAMFSSGMKESNTISFPLHDIDSQLFEEILQYIYLDKDIVSAEIVGKLLEIAYMLQISSLQRKCEEFILKNIDASNCLGIWKMGKSHNVDTLIDDSYPFILNNFDDVWETEDFLKLEKNDLESLLCDKCLNVSGEEVVCKALLRWISDDEARRKSSFPELFSHIRLTSVSLQYLLDHLDQHPMVVEHSACQMAVKNAIKYHALPSRRQELIWDENPYRSNTGQEQVLAVVGKFLDSDGTFETKFIGYSFSSKKWVALDAITADIGDHFAVCSYGYDIYITGGTANMSICLGYSAKFSKWRKRSRMNFDRYRHSMVAVPYSLFVFGGYNLKTLNSVEQYDIESESWKQVGELQFGVDGSSAVVIDEKVYIFGGSINVTKEFQGIQCFDTKTYTCSLIANLCTPPKFTSAIKFLDLVRIVCENGEVISFSARKGPCVIQKIKNFSRKNFGLFMHQGALCVIGGKQNVYSDDEKLCSDVIRVNGEETDTLNAFELPFPMEIISCMRTAVARYGPLLDCEPLWT